MSNFIIPNNSPNLGKKELEKLIQVYNGGWPTEGKITSKFEKLLSKYLSSHVVVVNNGSSALMASLLANDIKPGDKIVVPDFTFVATSSIPKILGAKIIPCDVDGKTFNIDPKKLETILKSNQIKALMLVDVAGVPCDIDTFVNLAKKYNFIIIEDAAQSFGSEYRQKKLGSFKHATVFSFQIVKQITTIEGGCIASTDLTLINKIRRIKDYGRNLKDRYSSDYIGSNFRTTDLQSAIGITQLEKLDRHLRQRKKITELYRKNIQTLEFQNIPNYVTKNSNQICFCMAKDQKSRDFIVKSLQKNKIDCRKPWTPIHLQPCNPELKNYLCTNTEEIFTKLLSLPLYSGMKISDAKRIIEIINSLNI